MSVNPANSAAGSQATNCCSGKTVSGCSKSTSSEWSKKLLRVIVLVTHVGLGVFAYITCPSSFLLSYGIGKGLGFVCGVLDRYNVIKLTYVDDAAPACAQNFMEYLSGIRFPVLIAKVITVAYIARHIVCDSPFYVPFVGVFLGFKTGRIAGSVCVDIAGWCFKCLKPAELKSATAAAAA